MELCQPSSDKYGEYACVWIDLKNILVQYIIAFKSEEVFLRLLLALWAALLNLTPCPEFPSRNPHTSRD